MPLEEQNTQDNDNFDMSELLQHAQRMQEQFMQAQEKIAEAEATGTAADGAVRATVAGDGFLKDLHLDPSVIDPSNAEKLSELVVEAVRSGQEEIQQIAATELGAIEAEDDDFLDEDDVDDNSTSASQ